MNVMSGILLSCFAILILILGLTTHHVYNIERNFTISARGIGTARRNALSHEEEEDKEEEDDEDEESEQIEEDRENGVAQDMHEAEERKKRLVLTKQAFYQSLLYICLLYTSPSPRDRQKSRMPSSA